MMRTLAPIVLALVTWKCLELGMRVLAPEASASWPVSVTISMVAAIVAYIGVEVVLLGLDFSHAGLAPGVAVSRVAAGVALGSALFAVVLAIFRLGGWYEPVELLEPSARSLAAAALALTFAAVTEEIVFRGMVLRRASAALGPWFGLAVSSIAFGLAHLTSTRDVAAAAVVGLGGGLLFGAAYLVTGTLWLPIGMHAGWNLVQAGAFGFPTGSGVDTDLVRATISGPAWLVGRPGSPESGLVVLIVCVLVAGTLLKRYGSVGNRSVISIP